MKLKIEPSRVRGRIAVPGSKSHTIRGIAAALMTGGESRLIAPLSSEDTCSVLRCARQLGAGFREEGRDWIITGNGGNFPREKITLNLGNSGTGMRFLTALAAAGGADVTIDGDDSLRTRPMQGLLDALQQLGCTAESANGRCPLTVRGPLSGGSAKVDGTTSQFISALLFAAGYAEKDCDFTLDFLNEQPYVGITLQWLTRLGIAFEAADNMLHFRVKAGQRIAPFSAVIPADFSTALFPVAAAMIAGDGVAVCNLDFEDVQGDKACFEFFAAMGAKITAPDASTRLIQPSERLRGGVFDLNATPDALPVMAAAAAAIDAETRLVNVPQARLKETDRITCMTRELRKMGADVQELPDGMVIRGGNLCGAELEGYGDHRIVMALAVAALTADSPSVIAGAEAAAVTYPDFITDFQKMQAKMSEEQ